MLQSLYTARMEKPLILTTILTSTTQTFVQPCTLVARVNESTLSLCNTAYVFCYTLAAFINTKKTEKNLMRQKKSDIALRVKNILVYETKESLCKYMKTSSSNVQCKIKFIN